MEKKYVQLCVCVFTSVVLYFVVSRAHRLLHVDALVKQRSDCHVYVVSTVSINTHKQNISQKISNMA